MVFIETSPTGGTHYIEPYNMDRLIPITPTNTLTFALTADMSDPLSRGYWEDFLAFLGGIARGLTTLIFEGWLPPGQWFRRELRRLKTRIVNNDAIIAVTRIAQPNAP